MTVTKALAILGIRGIPAAHGGFETFAERLALYLVENGWRVTVYCQHEGSGDVWEDCWNRVDRVNIPVTGDGSFSSMVFDYKATRIAAARGELCLTLGYNTAVFCAMLRLRKVPNLINMDGIEWSRAKWGRAARSWLWFNDWCGCWLGNHLIADHPEIKSHLMTRVSGDKVTMIPYGADPITEADEAPVRALGLEPGRYLTVIARPEPENSLLEIVQGFSAKRRGVQLVVLGRYSPETVPFHRQVMAAASDEVCFVGAIYDQAIVKALRYHSVAYVHGHQVGGTNPSLVEALGAGNAVIAHDNRFNRWVAGEEMLYFCGADGFSSALEQLLEQSDLCSHMQAAARARFQRDLTWPAVLAQYESLLIEYLCCDEVGLGATEHISS